MASSLLIDLDLMSQSRHEGSFRSGVEGCMLLVHVIKLYV